MLGYVTTLALSADKPGGAKNRKLYTIQTFPLLLIHLQLFLTTWEGINNMEEHVKSTQ